jgi:thiamine monophosphate synthase
MALAVVVGDIDENDVVDAIVVNASVVDVVEAVTKRANNVVAAAAQFQRHEAESTIVLLVLLLLLTLNF